MIQCTSYWLQAFTTDAIRSQISIGQVATPLNAFFDKIYNDKQNKLEEDEKGNLFMPMLPIMQFQDQAFRILIDQYRRNQQNRQIIEYFSRVRGSGVK